MNIKVLDYALSTGVSIVSNVISVLIARKFAKKFSWVSVLLFLIILSGAVVFIIPIVFPLVTTYYLNDGITLNSWYTCLAGIEFGEFITDRLDYSSFEITLKIIVNLLYLLYDFGLCIVTSFLLKKNGIIIFLLWYFLNSSLLVLITIVAVVIVLLLPVFIIYRIIVGICTGIKNYILSFKHTYRKSYTR